MCHNSVFQGFILLGNHDAYRKQRKQKPFRYDNSKEWSLIIIKNYYPCYVPYIFLIALHILPHLTFIRIPWSGMLLLIPVYKTLGTERLIWQRLQEIEKIKIEFFMIISQRTFSLENHGHTISLQEECGGELAVSAEVNQGVGNFLSGLWQMWWAWSISEEPCFPTNFSTRFFSQ